MAYHDVAFRSLLERTQQAHIREVCKRPATEAIYRLMAYSLDGQARHSVATLHCQSNQRKHQLDVVYDGLFDHKPIVHQIDETHVEAFVKQLRKARFDTLDDDPDLVQASGSIWCLERATGTHYHRVLLAPNAPKKPYSLIVNAIDSYLPEAIRIVSY